MRLAFAMRRANGGVEFSATLELFPSLGTAVADLIKSAPAWRAEERDAKARAAPRFMRPAFQNMTNGVFSCACGTCVSPGEFHAMGERCGGPP